MSKRIAFLVTTLVCTACFVAVGMMWQTMTSALAVATDLRQMMEETRATNRALMETLTQLSARTSAEGTAAPSAKSHDQNLVKARMVEKDGPPAEGCIVRLSRKSPRDAGKFETIAEERTGPDGVAELSFVPPGKYILSAMGGPVNCEWFSTDVIVSPGSTPTIDIVCPPAKIGKANVVVRAEIPEDLRRRNLYLTAELVLGPRDFSGCHWRSGFNGVEANDPLFIVVIAPDGQVGVTCQGIIDHSFEGEPIQMLNGTGKGQFFASPEERPLDLFSSDYYLRTIRIARPIGSSSGQSTSPSMLAVKSEWHFLPEKKRIYPGMFLDYKVANGDLPLLQKFEIATGEQTEWRIVVPEEFWTQARADLERAEKASAQLPPNPVEPVRAF